MTSIAALSAAALLAGLSSSPLLGPAPAAGGDITLEQAGHIVSKGEQVYDLSDGVVIRRGSVVLRARTATLNQATGEVQANGDVLLVDATRAIQADGVHAILDGPFEASNVVAFFKDRPLEPNRVTSMAEARHGRNRLTFSAGQVEGEDEDHLTLRDVRFTLCDCGEGKAPSWELGAPRAKVDGDRVALSWPVFRVTPRFLFIDHPVPVLVLPWISLPLTDRQTGVLFPDIGQRRVTGWTVRVPIFVTLGRSADLTATPEYFFGPKDQHAAGGAVAGPGLGLELRWAPAERAEGQVLFHAVDDLVREQPGGRGAAGLRLSVEGEHRQDLGAGTRLVSHLSLSQDPYMFRDFRGLALPGDPYYSRSDVLVSHRFEDWVVEGDARYLEPLVGVAPGVDIRPRRFGWFGVQAPLLQRWPSAAAELLPVPLGPVQLEGRVGVSRYAPLTGHTGELLPTDPAARSAREGVTVTYSDLGDGAQSLEVNALRREAVTRADARLQLSAPFLLGETISVEPFVRGASLGYAFDARRQAAATAWGVAGISSFAELARSYGKVEHRIVPRLEVLAGTGTWRANPGDPFPAYDLWDRVETGRAVPVPWAAEPQPIAQKLSAAPNGDYDQLRLTLENSLQVNGRRLLAVQLGQDVDLRAGRMAESSAALRAAAGPFSASGEVRLLAFGGRPPLADGARRSWLDAFTRLRLDAAAHDARGDSVRAALDATGSGAVGAQAAGVDALFDLRSSGVAPDAWYTLGAHTSLGGAGLDYSIRLAARNGMQASCQGGKTRTLSTGQPSGQDATLIWDSPCHCFVARVRAALDACGDPSFGFDIDLSRILQGAGRGG